MKTKCYPKICYLFCVLYFSVCANMNAQMDTITITESFASINLKEIAKTYNSAENTTIYQVYKQNLSTKKKNKKNLFVPIDKDNSFITFCISNKSSEKQDLIVEINNALINNISFYEKKIDSFILVNQTGSDFPFSSRLINDRNYLYPITLLPNETGLFAFQFKKKQISLNIPAKVWNKNSFDQYHKTQLLIIGLYIGLSVLSILLSLYIFSLLRMKVYFIYALYVISVGLYLISDLGLYFQYFINKSKHFDKYIHVLFMVFTLVFLVLFSKKILNSKIHSPKISKALNFILILVILFRFSDFILPDALFLKIKPIIMNLWYASFLIINLGIIILIINSYKHQKQITIYFSIAYSFMSIGTIISIISITTGLLSAYFFGLPIVFYASFLEIGFLSFAIVLLVKDIYIERNMLSEKILIQQKNFLTAFMKGENRERKRISKELHDNIGSKLGYLKRFASDTFNNENINTTIDDICTDVRNLSHEISPSDLKLVGFENAVAELSQNISMQTSIQIDFNSYHFPDTLNENTTTQLYRVIQEAINNTLKHANAKHIDIQLIGHEETATISIEDDGAGFDFSTNKRGLGLKNMASRIKEIHGTFTIDSQPNTGTSILINIPI